MVIALDGTGSLNENTLKQVMASPSDPITIP